jgi:hypothetical protein
VHAAKATPSSEHSNVAPVGVDVKLKLALVLVLAAVGDAVMVVSDGVTVNVNVAGVGSVPAVFTARTWNVWLPPVSPV